MSTSRSSFWVSSTHFFSKVLMLSRSYCILNNLFKRSSLSASKIRFSERISSNSADFVLSDSDMSLCSWLDLNLGLERSSNPNAPNRKSIPANDSMKPASHSHYQPPSPPHWSLRKTYLFVEVAADWSLAVDAGFKAGEDPLTLKLGHCNWPISPAFASAFFCLHR